MDAQRIIARRTVIGLPSGGLSPVWEKDFAQFPPAGVIIFSRDFGDLTDARRLVARLRELARPRRLFVSLDEEGGWVSQLAGQLVVPPNAATLARVADPATISWIAGVTARRLHALGFDWDFAPGGRRAQPARQSGHRTARVGDDTAAGRGQRGRVARGIPRHGRGVVREACARARRYAHGLTPGAAGVRCRRGDARSARVRAVPCAPERRLADDRACRLSRARSRRAGDVLAQDRAGRVARAARLHGCRDHRRARDAGRGCRPHAGRGRPGRARRRLRPAALRHLERRGAARTRRAGQGGGRWASSTGRCSTRRSRD